MKELAAAGGVPVATAKYYLREGLLPPGRATGATRAEYDDAHVRRLRLVRALVDVAGMSLQQVREVLAVVDGVEDRRGATSRDGGVAQAIGSAHLRLSPPPGTTPGDLARARVRRLLEERGWRVAADGPHALALAAALDAMTAAGQPLEEGSLAVYAEAAESMAASDVGALGGRDPVEATTYAIIGTLLTEPVILALRRMAQEDRARRRAGPHG